MLNRNYFFFFFHKFDFDCGTHLNSQNLKTILLIVNDKNIIFSQIHQLNATLLILKATLEIRMKIVKKRSLGL